MLYIDVDALCKLAHWKILPLLPELTGYEWKDMATVSSLIHRAARAVDRPDGKLFRCADAAKLACECIARMGPPAEPDPQVLTDLSDSPQIDAGEAVLLATTVADPGGRFLTGDKRALRALSQQRCAEQFAGRIVMIEQVLWRCLQTHGREWMLTHLCPFKDLDKATAMILGSRCDGSAESILEGIQSYVREIAVLCDPSLLDGYAEMLPAESAPDALAQ